MLVAAEPLRQVGAQIVEIELLRVRLHDGVHDLTEVVVRQADHRAGLDVRVLVESGLDLCRVNVGAADQDHVAVPVG